MLINTHIWVLFSSYFIWYFSYRGKVVTILVFSLNWDFQTANMGPGTPFYGLGRCESKLVKLISTLVKLIRLC